MRQQSNKLFVIIFLSMVLVLLSLFYVYLFVSAPPTEAVWGKYIRPILGIYAVGNHPGQTLKQPSDVAFDAGGRIYVADTGGGRIAVFDQNGRFSQAIGTRVGPDRLALPMGVSVGENGLVYVADQARDRVVTYSRLGRVLSVLPITDPIKPLAHENRLYVAAGSRVYVFNIKTYRRLFTIVLRKNGNELGMAGGVAVGAQGEIFVSDIRDRVVREFDRSGKYKRSIGGPSANKGPERRYGLPVGLAVDDANELYVVDAFYHQIEVVRRASGPIRVSQKGQREGELYFPQGIAYWRNGVFAVADKYNDRIQLLKIDTSRPLRAY